MRGREWRNGGWGWRNEGRDGGMRGREHRGRDGWAEEGDIRDWGRGGGRGEGDGRNIRRGDGDSGRRDGRVDMFNIHVVHFSSTCT